MRRPLPIGAATATGSFRFLPWTAPAEEENADTQKDESEAGNAEPKKEQGERNARHGLQREEELLAFEPEPLESGNARPRVSTGLLSAMSTAQQGGVGGGHGGLRPSVEGATDSGRTGRWDVGGAVSGPTGRRSSRDPHVGRSLLVWTSAGVASLMLGPRAVTVFPERTTARVRFMSPRTMANRDRWIVGGPRAGRCGGQTVYRETALSALLAGPAIGQRLRTPLRVRPMSARA